MRKFRFLKEIAKKVILIFLKYSKPKRKYILIETGETLGEGTYIFYKWLKDNNKAKNVVWIFQPEFKKKYKLDNKIFKKVISCEGDTFIKQFKLQYYSKKCRWYLFSHINAFDYKYGNKKAIKLFFVHGQPFKKVPKYLINTTKDSYLMVNNHFVKSIYRKAYSFDENKYFECYNPRLLSHLYPKKSKIELCNLLKIDLSCKIIAYLTTWDRFCKKTDRIYKEFEDCFAFKITKNDLKTLNEKYRQRKEFLIVKTHPMMYIDKSLKNPYSNILFFDNTDFANLSIDIFEFLSITDAIITDFSSIFIEYLVLHKPIYFISSEKRNKRIVKIAYNSKNFLLKNPKKFMPGKLLHSFDDLININTDKDAKIYYKKLLCADKLWNQPRDYDCCKRIYDFLIKKEKETNLI